MNYTPETLQSQLQVLVEGRRSYLLLNADDVTTGKELEQAAQAIREAPALHSLTLDGIAQNRNAVDLLIDAVASRTDIEYFSFFDIAMTDGQSRKLADALIGQRHLQSLSFRENVDGNQLQHFAEVVDKHQDIRTVRFTLSDWSQESSNQLAVALADKRKLIKLDLTGYDARLDDTEFETALLQHPHPNLISIQGMASSSLSEMIRRNVERRINAEVLLQPVGEDDAHIKVTQQALFMAEAQRAVLELYVSAKMQDYDDFLGTLPELPRRRESFAEALFKADETGFAPLENPLVWKSYPDMLARLVEENRLTTDTLLRKTRKQTRLIDAALAYLPADKVIGACNVAGIRIGAEMLGVDAQAVAQAVAHGKQPEVPLLDVLMAKGEAKAVFCPNNMAGASPKEIRVIAACLEPQVRGQLHWQIGQRIASAEAASVRAANGARGR